MYENGKLKEKFNSEGYTYPYEQEYIYDQSYEEYDYPYDQYMIIHMLKNILIHMNKNILIHMLKNILIHMNQ